MRLRNGLLAVLAATAAFPASAQAADFTGEVSADALEYAWEGVGTGIPLSAAGIVMGDASPFGCGTPGHDCDYVKLNVVHPGTLTLTVDFSEGAQDVEGIVGYPDLDASIYKAGADGQPEGESLTGTDCGTGATVETCETESLQPGAYLVEVSFFLADETSYKAKVALKTAVPPTPPGAAPAAGDPPPSQPAPGEPGQPAAPQQQAPPAQPHSADEPKPKAKKKKSKKAACQKKAKKIKNKGKRKKALKRCARMK